MNRAYLLIGGNVGDRHRNLDTALSSLATKAGVIAEKSARYETAAWGETQQPAFLNQAVLVLTNLSATDLLQTILEIETKMGRVRTTKYGPRIIDIDIIFYESLVIHEKGLTIPHPQMAERRFVLTPLAEIAGTVVHPVLKKSVQQLLRDCADPLPVKKLSN